MKNILLIGRDNLPFALGFIGGIAIGYLWPNPLFLIPVLGVCLLCVYL